MFKKATKSQIKVRLALSGASGAGKTFTSLKIASHLGASVAVIDTEKGSSNRYADKFNFDVCELNDFHPAKYIELIKMAESSYDVLVIDSLSHAWFAELEIAESNFKNWAKIRPIERKLIEAMTGAKCHIIATMRSKTEWVLEETVNKQGKTTMSPRKVGMAPIQTSGIEYEFDIAGDMDYNHMLTVSKSRCQELADRTFLHPGKDIADIMLSWISAPQPQIQQTPQQPVFIAPQAAQTSPTKTVTETPFLGQQRQDIQKDFIRLKWSENQIKECLLNNFNSEGLIEFSSEQLAKLKMWIEVFEKSTDLIKQIGWTPEQGKNFLQQHYDKQSRTALNANELEEFVDYLKDLVVSADVKEEAAR